MAEERLDASGRDRRKPLWAFWMCITYKHIAKGMTTVKDFIDRRIVAEYCQRFNAQDEEPYQGDVPNARAEDFLIAEIPRFECPDPVFQEIWYFRWWSFRKHIRRTPFGRIILEFMPDVPWAGAFNTINCPAAHQLREARWLKDKGIAEEYLSFWLNPEAKAAVRSYTFGVASAALDVVAVTGKDSLALELYPALCANYAKWKETHLGPDGLFRQQDGRDGMECSIGGSGYRVTINSCMAAEAMALAAIGRRVGDTQQAELYRQEAEQLRQLIETRLWNDEAEFFMTRREEDGAFVQVRELHGYTPWYYFPKMAEKYDLAWRQLLDPEGFLAPFGPTTAERRHPGFQLDRSGHECQWNGPSWPFATSVTLTGLARLLHERTSAEIGCRGYFETLTCYTRSHYLRENGQVIPWIDENIHPFTGEWLAREILRSWERAGIKSRAWFHERGKDYSHSTYADLIITGLCGINPDLPGKVRVAPLLPAECWDYFLLEGLWLRGHELALQFDRDGSRYQRGRGLALYVDGTEAARCEDGIGVLEVAL